MQAAPAACANRTTAAVTDDAAPDLPDGAWKLPDAGPDLDWMMFALCQQVDPEKWFPVRGASVTDAKRICRDCPVRTQCLQYALDNDERFGIWGGLSERERRRLKRGPRERARDMAALGRAS